MIFVDDAWEFIWTAGDSWAHRIVHLRCDFIWFCIQHWIHVLRIRKQWEHGEIHFGEFICSKSSGRFIWATATEHHGLSLDFKMWVGVLECTPFKGCIRVVYLAVTFVVLTLPSSHHLVLQQVMSPESHPSPLHIVSVWTGRFIIKACSGQHGRLVVKCLGNTVHG